MMLFFKSNNIISHIINTYGLYIMLHEDSDKRGNLIQTGVHQLHVNNEKVMAN